MSQPAWLFIVGPARSGTTLLASLLDGHPDLLVWPFEWRYFTEFFGPAAGGRDTAPVGDLLTLVAPLVKRFEQETFSTYYSAIDVSGAVDYRALATELAGTPESMITADGFLALVFDGLARALLPPRPAARYRVLKCMTKGFDWRNGDLLARARFLYLERPAEKRYMSQRNKFIEKFDCGPVETFARCRRLFFEIKLADEVTRGFGHLQNFLTIDLHGLQTEPERTMREVAAFLHIPFDPVLLAPTFLGKPFAGHFHDESLNRGAVTAAESRHTPLLSYERLLLKALAAGVIPPFEDLIPTFVQSIFEELDTIFRGISQADRAAVAQTLLSYYLELQRLVPDRLLESSHLEWKEKYPFIV